MNDIKQIYINEIGVSFRWIHENSKLTQLVFRDTGFHLSEEEIEIFLEKVEDAKHQKKCKKCKLSRNCRSILLQTPSNKISIAVSSIELRKIEDLLRGTIFQLRLNNYLKEICKN